MPVDNLQIVLAERPTAEIIPGTTFHQRVTPAPTEADLADGDVLVETLYLSLDPAMRGWLKVGGEILELALRQAKEFSRFVMCGAISQYNAAQPVGPRNLTRIIQMRIRMQGFIVFDHKARYPEARADLARLLADGKLKTSIHLLKGGLQVAEQGLVDLYKGINTGKLIVELKNPDESPAKL